MLKGGYEIVTGFLTSVDLYNLGNGDTLDLTDEQIEDCKRWAFSGKALQLQLINKIGKYTEIKVRPMYVYSGVYVGLGGNYSLNGVDLVIGDTDFIMCEVSFSQKTIKKI